MPGFDGTGPWGQGPMTGGGRGFCNAGAGGRRWFERGAGRYFGRGRRCGFGPGRGYGWSGWEPAYYGGVRYASPMNRDQEIGYLQNQAREIKEELEDIEARISELQQNES